MRQTLSLLQQAGYFVQRRLNGDLVKQMHQHLPRLMRCFQAVKQDSHFPPSRLRPNYGTGRFVYRNTNSWTDSNMSFTSHFYECMSRVYSTPLHCPSPTPPLNFRNTVEFQNSRPIRPVPATAAASGICRRASSQTLLQPNE